MTTLVDYKAARLFARPGTTLECDHGVERAISMVRIMSSTSEENIEPVHDKHQKVGLIGIGEENEWKERGVGEV